jgi:acetyl-CoA acetyltransferase
MNFLTSYALFASAWMDRRRISEELIADAAAHSYRAAAENPYAHVKERFSRDDVLQSDMIAAPLRERTVAMRRSYGAAALILASEDTARRLAVEPLSVAGFGMSTFADDLDDWLEMSAVKKAARAAYEMTGLTDPAAQAAAVEINGPFTPFELAAWSALGLCSAGDEAALLAATANGGVRINPSGGTLCTNAPNSGGLFRVVQAILSLQSAAVHDGRTRAIVHDSDLSLGIAGSSHAVLVLEKG